MDIDNYLKLYQ